VKNTVSGRTWPERRRKGGERTGRWVGIVDFGRDENGRRKTRQRSFAREREAKAWVEEQLGRARDGVFVDPSKKTVAAFLLETWLPSKRRLRPSTLDSYRRMIVGHVVPATGNVRLQHVTAPMLNQLFADLAESGRKERGSRVDGSAGLTPRTVNYIRSMLVTAWSDAVRWQLVARNVVLDSERMEESDFEANTWSPDELRRFLDFVSDERLATAFRVVAMTGLRRAELLGLRWSDVDLPAGKLWVRRTLIAVEHRPSFGKPKTKRGARRIDIDPATVHALREHKARQNAEKLRWGPAYGDGDLIFCQENGAPVHPESFGKVFDRRVARSGLPRVRFHDLRHSHVAHLIAAGVHRLVISRRLGHASLSFTMDRYGHLIEELQPAAAKDVAALVDR
jgi:integrase